MLLTGPIKIKCIQLKYLTGKVWSKWHISSAFLSLGLNPNTRISSIHTFDHQDPLHTCIPEMKEPFTVAACCINQAVVWVDRAEPETRTNHNPKWEGRCAGWSVGRVESVQYKPTNPSTGSQTFVGFFLYKNKPLLRQTAEFNVMFLM